MHVRVNSIYSILLTLEGGHECFVGLKVPIIGICSHVGDA